MTEIQKASNLRFQKFPEGSPIEAMAKKWES
jgi:hypothetical protein